jgi:hypothetical protein
VERVALDLRLGVSLARRDHEVLLVFVATMLINGAALV